MRDLNTFKFLLGMNLGDLWIGEGFDPPKPSVCLLIVKTVSF